MRVCDVSKTDDVQAVATVTITMIGEDGQPQTDPIASFMLDVGERAATALGRRDWAELGRIQPSSERSKDPTRVAAAVNRTRGPKPAAGAAPSAGPGAPSANES